MIERASKESRTVNNREESAMMDAIQQQFKELSAELVHEYETEHQAMAERRHYGLERARARQREVHEIMRAGGFDVSGLESLLGRDSKALPQRVQETLPSFVNRERNAAADARNHAVLSGIHVADRLVLPPFAHNSIYR
jgi:hypothetical protein